MRLFACAAFEFVDDKICVIKFRFPVQENENLIIPVEHKLHLFRLCNLLDDPHDFLFDGAEQRICRHGKFAVVAEFFLVEHDLAQLLRIPPKGYVPPGTTAPTQGAVAKPFPVQAHRREKKRDGTGG